MKCEKWLPLIEEYFDGELDDRASKQVSAHIDSCDSCRMLYDELTREHKAYLSYKRDLDLEISPALWAGIDSRVKAEKAASQQSGKLYQWFTLLVGGPRLSPALAAALVLLAVAATVVTMRYWGREHVNPNSESQGGAPTNTIAKIDGHPTPAPSVQPPPDQKDGKPDNPQAPAPNGVRHPLKSAAPARRQEISPEQVVREAEEKQLAAIAVLNRAVDRRRSTLDPSVVAKFQVALTAIDRTIAETRSAVKQNPGDPVAAQYMLAAYGEKIEMLKDMAGQ
jgi:hypothetical protein